MAVLQAGIPSANSANSRELAQFLQFARRLAVVDYRSGQIPTVGQTPRAAGNKQGRRRVQQNRVAPGAAPFQRRW